MDLLIAVKQNGRVFIRAMPDRPPSLWPNEKKVVAVRA